MLVNQMILGFGTMFACQVGCLTMINFFDTFFFFYLYQSSVIFDCCSHDQDSGGMLSLLGTIDQCLKTGRRQAWHAASVTNICAALLAGLKVSLVFGSLVICCKQFLLASIDTLFMFLQALLSLRSQPLGMEILNAAQAIFQVFTCSARFYRIYDV